MDVEKIFHMKGGHGETSYSKNSSLQKLGSDMVKHITMETIQEVYLATTPQSLSIADLGCSSGPNTLSVIKDLYHAVENAYDHHKNRIINGPDSPQPPLPPPPPPPQLCVYLNDLPTNDFNSIFRTLPHFLSEEVDGKHAIDVNNQGHVRPSLFVAASPGSFYAPVFPPNFLHFVYSSYSLHWLSQVPSGIYDEHGKSMNKGCVYICSKSPPSVIQAYAQQFQNDFSHFLKLRSQELTIGGRMVLIFLGRETSNHIDRGNSVVWELLTRSFNILVSKGLVEEEKVDSYDVHFYAPCKEEIQEALIKEGSFNLGHLEMYEMERGERFDTSYGVKIARTVRAIQESMISHHFGEGIVEPLFETYGQMVCEELSKQEIRPITFVLVVSKM